MRCLGVPFNIILAYVNCIYCAKVWQTRYVDFCWACNFPRVIEACLSWLFMCIYAGEVQCEQPNNSLYTFTGNLIIQKQTLPLSPNQILLRV